MPRYFISYDLKRASENRPAVERAINSHGQAVRLLETVWYLRSSSSAETIRDTIGAVIDRSYKLLVIRADHAAVRGMPEAAWDNVSALW